MLSPKHQDNLQETPTHKGLSPIPERQRKHKSLDVRGRDQSSDFDNQIRKSPKSSFVQMGMSLTEARQQRKIIEYNARILATRLSVLNAEEEKIKRRALDLQKKAKQTLQERIDREKKVL